MLSETKLDVLLGTLMDKETFGDSNYGIFNSPNPENMTPQPVGKPTILKFKLIYSTALLPEGGSLADLLQYLAIPGPLDTYK